MAPTNEQKQAISEWLTKQLAAAAVSSHYDFSRETTLFTVRRDPGTVALEITDSAFEDYPVAEIIRDLTEEKLVERFARDPTMRAQYVARQKLLGHECLYISCDGRQYRVIRDGAHNVRVFDDSDRPLDRAPRGMLVLPGSLFSRSEAQWCADIRSWRGQQQ